MFVLRVEALRPSILGWWSATLTELLMLAVVLLRSVIESITVPMTMKIVEEKCIDITIMLKSRENDNEL